MALAYKTRRRLALFLLLVWLPVYVVVAVNVIDLFDRPPFWAELAMYVVLAFAWVLPLRAVFRGVGQADPEAGKKADGPRGPSA